MMRILWTMSLDEVCPRRSRHSHRIVCVPTIVEVCPLQSRHVPWIVEILTNDEFCSRRSRRHPWSVWILTIVEVCPLRRPRSLWSVEILMIVGVCPLRSCPGLWISGVCRVFRCYLHTSLREVREGLEAIEWSLRSLELRWFEPVGFLSMVQVGVVNPVSRRRIGVLPEHRVLNRCLRLVAGGANPGHSSCYSGLQSVLRSAVP